MKPSIGRIVIYNTTEEERENMQIRGNGPKQLPAIITAVWSETCINVKVIQDNYLEDLWKKSIAPGDGEGQWNWPERV